MHPSNYGQLGRRSGCSYNKSVTSGIRDINTAASGNSFLGETSHNESLVHPTGISTEQNTGEDNECNTISDVNNHSRIRRKSISEDRLKKRIRYFFMNPYEKWRCKRRFPWKLTIQIFKIFIVTAQVSMFATQRYNHVSYLMDTKISLSHLFIKDWATSMEVNSYPPSSGPLAVYKIQDFYQSVDYAILMFAQIEKTALGTYTFAKKGELIHMPQFCYSQYKKSRINLDNLTYVVDKEIIENCINIPTSILLNGSDWSIKEYLDDLDHNINFVLLLGAKLRLTLRTIRLTLELSFQAPECYQLENIIYFNNRYHNGQMVIESDLAASVLNCNGFVDSVNEAQKSNLVRNIINGTSFCVCLISFIMCFRSLYKAHHLKITTEKYFRSRLKRCLTNQEKCELINLWYILICISDILIVTGTIVKMTLEGKDYEGFLDKWTYCALLLGIGNLLVWFGCLRFLCFFDTYNILILTIKSCFSSVIRFSVCMLIVFGGYSLCGWLVLGPYNLKFRSFYSTVECLFGLINGDDMFSTFVSTSSKDKVVWWFSRFYLYTFISLFVYVILSLFIAIIMESYDTIKNYYKDGFPKSGLMQFAFECEGDPYSRGYWDDQERTIHDIVNSFIYCTYWRHSPLVNENIP